MEDGSTIEWAFKGAVFVLFTVGGWLWVQLIADVRRLGSQLVEAEKSLAAYKLGSENSLSEYKLESERRYAKEDQVAENFNKLSGIMNALQNAVNTNTTMTSVIMEKVTTLAARVDNKP